MGCVWGPPCHPIYKIFVHAVAMASPEQVISYNSAISACQARTWKMNMLEPIESDESRWLASHSQKVAIWIRGHDKQNTWELCHLPSRWYKGLVQMMFLFNSVIFRGFRPLTFQVYVWCPFKDSVLYLGGNACMLSYYRIFAQLQGL